jgi:hypothetical protein
LLSVLESFAFLDLSRFASSGSSSSSSSSSNRTLRDELEREGQNGDRSYINGTVSPISNGSSSDESDDDEGGGDYEVKCREGGEKGQGKQPVEEGDEEEKKQEEGAPAEAGGECAICLENLTQPQALPQCGHKFCMPCLKRMQASAAVAPSLVNRRGILLRCPMCRCEQRVPM